jgi:hypothetical protein
MEQKTPDGREQVTSCTDGPLSSSIEISDLPPTTVHVISEVTIVEKTTNPVVAPLSPSESFTNYSGPKEILVSSVSSPSLLQTTRSYGTTTSDTLPTTTSPDIEDLDDTSTIIAVTASSDTDTTVLNITDSPPSISPPGTPTPTPTSTATTREEDLVEVPLTDSPPIGSPITDTFNTTTTTTTLILVSQAQEGTSE